MGGRFLYLILTAALVSPVFMQAQLKAADPLNAAPLGLSAEVAATTQQGQPAVLRITLKNSGNIAADLPMPGIGCSSDDGALIVRFEWHSNDPNDHSGRGWGCGGGSDHGQSLMDRVRNQWIELQPGEFLTVSENLRPYIGSMEPGTVEYWVEYTPPTIKPEELIALKTTGFTAPTEKLITDRHTFSVN